MSSRSSRRTATRPAASAAWELRSSRCSTAASAASSSISPKPKTARRCTGYWPARMCFWKISATGSSKSKGLLAGPYEHRPALDEVVQMMSGLAAMTGTREKPHRIGSSANDIMGGMFGAISILAALYQKRGGRGDGADIRIGLFENCLFLVAQHMVEYEMTGNT